MNCKKMKKMLDFEAWQGIAMLISYLLFATTFSKYSITSNYRYTQTDVYGTIVARVKIGCDGNWSVVEWNVKGTSWYGGENEMTRVFRDFIKESKFYKIGDNCGETALITLNVRKTF